MTDTNLLVIFSTGLFTGGLTCLAVQGGLLATTIAQREEERLKEKTSVRGGSASGGKKTGNALPIFYFLAAKLVAYTLLGLLLGWFGSLFQLSLGLKVFMQFAVGFFMIGTALSLLNAYPVFRYFIIQPPKFLTRLVRNQSKSNDIFAPALLGLLTIFIPCGTTQAMMALAIASGSPLLGMAIMFAFILGTSPIFFVLGYFASKLGDVWHRKFMKLAAWAIILLALFNINGAIALTGSEYTTQDIICNNFIECGDGENSKTAAENTTSTVTEQTITIGAYGYTPNNFAVKAGSSVTLNLLNSGGQGCTQAFTIPRLSIQKIVPYGSSNSVTFTAPNQPQQLAFMCSMGMYRGVINVN